MLSRPVVFDASVLLNLLATRQPAKLIRSLGSQGLVCSAVADEALYIRSERLGEPPELVNLQPLLDTGVLEICELQGDEEYGLYVRYAMNLDDGEAMSLAICAARGHAVATDDRKARRLASLSHQIELLGTPEILQCWASVEQPDAQQIREVLRRIEVSARFHPNANDPLRAWWDSFR